MAQITKLIKLNQTDIYSSVHRNCDDLRGLVSCKYQLIHKTRLLWYIEICVCVWLYSLTTYGSLDKTLTVYQGNSHTSHSFFMVYYYRHNL